MWCSGTVVIISAKQQWRAFLRLVHFHKLAKVYTVVSSSAVVLSCALYLLRISVQSCAHWCASVQL